MNINKLRKVNLNLQKDRIKKGEAVKIINYLLETKYVYNFDWLGIPSIQFPSDLMVFQEVIYNYNGDYCGVKRFVHAREEIKISTTISMYEKKSRSSRDRRRTKAYSNNYNI